MSFRRSMVTGAMALLATLAVHPVGTARSASRADSLTTPENVTLLSPNCVPPGFISSSPALMLVNKLLGRNNMPEAEAFARGLLARYDREGIADSVLYAETLDFLTKAIRIGPDPHRAEAVQLAERAIAVKGRVLGEAHIGYARSLLNLGGILGKNGDYAGSLAASEGAHAIASRALAPNSLALIPYLVNLAAAKLDMNDKAGGAEMFRQVLWIRGHSEPPDSVHIGGDCVNYAAALIDLGDLRGAIEQYRIALRWLPREYDPEHPMVGTALASLAATELAIGERDDAMPLLRRALAIQRARLGPDHPDVSRTLSCIANLEADLGHLAIADSLFRQVIASHQRGLGERHPLVATDMTGLSAVLERKGDRAQAESLITAAYRMKRGSLGEDHIETSSALCDLARFHLRQGRARLALGEALHSERTAREQFERIASALPERTALSFASARGAGLDAILAAAGRSVSLTPDTLAAVWDAVIHARNLVQDESAARHRDIADAVQPRLAPLALELRATTDSLASLFIRGCGQNSLIACRGAFRAMSDRRDRLEEQIASASLEYRTQRARRRAGLETVVANLRPNDALVSYVRYSDESAPLGAPSPGGRYLALVRSPDGEVALVPLGPASRIDSLATAWNDAVRAGATGSWRARNEAIAHRFGIALRARIWDPIASRVRGAGRTFVVPDGTLGLVNLDALPAGADRFLAEVAPPFQYLSSERETVPSLRGTNRGLLAVGGTDFDANPRSVALVAAAFESTPKAPATYRGARSSCSDFNALRFEPLPGSAAEVRVVAGLWRAGAPPDEREQVRLLTGTEAGEAAFKRLAPSARILHVATHGFFLEGTCGGGTTPRARRATSGLQDEAIAGENPLLLSGLALAGSNQRERAATGDDDGVLTAQEIAAMNLDGMEWAVLSACESGVGRVQQREGVLGLPRAFLTAGCRTVVTSLWPVDDRAAQTWMASLYHYRLNDGLATPDCVRAASLEALRGRRHGNASTLPLYWASFLAIGGGR